MTNHSYTSIIWLSQGKYAIVDNEDYEHFSQWKWHKTGKGYAARAVKKRRIYMHKIIVPIPKGMVIDHINRNGFDNRRLNLRFVTCAENNINRSLFRNNKSGFKGVSFNSGSYHMQIGSAKNRIRMNGFKTALEAALLYDQKASEIFGEFAVTNKTLGLI